MKRGAVVLHLLLFLFLTVSPAFAISLFFEPILTKVNVGEQAEVRLFIDGLGNGTPPSLASFAIEIIFDDNLLSIQPNDVTYENFLGNPTNFVETDVVTTISVTPSPFSPGIITLDEVSFLSGMELDDLQPENFPLATLKFTGLTRGFSSLDFGFIDLSDAGFSPIQIIPSTVSSGKIEVVPEPSTVLLFGTGLVGIVIWSIQRQGRLSINRFDNKKSMTS